MSQKNRKTDSIRAEERHVAHSFTSDYFLVPVSVISVHSSHLIPFPLHSAVSEVKEARGNRSEQRRNGSGEWDVNGEDTVNRLRRSEEESDRRERTTHETKEGWAGLRSLGWVLGRYHSLLTPIAPQAARGAKWRVGPVPTVSGEPAKAPRVGWAGGTRDERSEWPAPKGRWSEERTWEGTEDTDNGHPR